MKLPPTKLGSPPGGQLSQLEKSSAKITEMKSRSYARNTTSNSVAVQQQGQVRRNKNALYRRVAMPQAPAPALQQAQGNKNQAVLAPTTSNMSIVSAEKLAGLMAASCPGSTTATVGVASSQQNSVEQLHQHGAVAAASQEQRDSLDQLMGQQQHSGATSTKKSSASSSSEIEMARGVVLGGMAVGDLHKNADDGMKTSTSSTRPPIKNQRSSTGGSKNSTVPESLHAQFLTAHNLPMMQSKANSFLLHPVSKEEAVEIDLSTNPGGTTGAQQLLHGTTTNNSCQTVPLNPDMIYHSRSFSTNKTAFDHQNCAPQQQELSQNRNYIEGNHNQEEGNANGMNSSHSHASSYYDQTNGILNNNPTRTTSTSLNKAGSGVISALYHTSTSSNKNATFSSSAQQDNIHAATARSGGIGPAGGGAGPTPNMTMRSKKGSTRTSRSSRHQPMSIIAEDEQDGPELILPGDVVPGPCVPSAAFEHQSDHDMLKHQQDTPTSNASGQINQQSLALFNYNYHLQSNPSKRKNRATTGNLLCKTEADVIRNALELKNLTDEGLIPAAGGYNYNKKMSHRSTTGEHHHHLPVFSSSRMMRGDSMKSILQHDEEHVYFNKNSISSTSTTSTTENTRNVSSTSGPEQLCALTTTTAHGAHPEDVAKNTTTALSPVNVVLRKKNYGTKMKAVSASSRNKNKGDGAALNNLQNAHLLPHNSDYEQLSPPGVKRIDDKPFNNNATTFMVQKRLSDLEGALASPQQVNWSPVAMLSTRNGGHGGTGTSTRGRGGRGGYY
ncbi:unnamed protein product [Amoebophrya sp. A120]|nr:unnamed protein product [Amoebophrya sp. A120]|eukprot:GSA120T00009324001.1